VPVTLSIQSGDKAAEHVVVIDESTTEKRYPLNGALKNVEVNADGAAVAIFEKR
jgi:hypothetical protein